MKQSLEAARKILNDCLTVIDAPGENHGNWWPGRSSLIKNEAIAKSFGPNQNKHSNQAMKKIEHYLYLSASIQYGFEDEVDAENSGCSFEEMRELWADAAYIAQTDAGI